jgi:hypothetical protein
LQYIEFLRSLNFDVTESHFFSGNQLKKSYIDGGYGISAVLKSYGRRVLDTMYHYKNTVWIVEKELFPYCPFCIERLFLPRCYIVDIDDAIHEQYAASSNHLVKRFLRSKIRRVLAGSSVAIVGSRSLADFAGEAGAVNVIYSPSAVDYADVLAARNYGLGSQSLPNSSEFRVCWIGSPSTSRYLNEISGFIERASVALGVKFIFIGVSQSHLNLSPLSNIEYVEWSETTQYQVISSCHVGIMPLPDQPFERGKCAYKLIQYMACGLPLLASPVGENKFVLKEGVSGFFCHDQASWLENLSKVLSSPNLRQKLSHGSMQEYTKKYSSRVAERALEKAVRDF